MAKPPRKPGIVAFTFPPDAPITPLPISEWRGVCTECESNRPMAEVRGAEGTPPRRLCGECLFKEFAPAQPDASEAPSLSPEDVRNAARNRSGPLLAEWTDLQWAMYQGPMTPELAEAFASTGAAGTPLAVPQANVVADPSDVRAAMLALVMLRGAVCEREFVSADRFLVEPSGDVTSLAASAELLARMPRPLTCAGRAEGDRIRLRCRTTTGKGVWERAMERRADEYDPYADQREQFGEALGEQKVFCLGCQESLIVTLAEAQRSRRDYRVSLLGSNEDRPSFYLGTDPAAARAAMLAGAVRMMKCFFGPDSWSDVEAGRAIVVRGPGDWEVKAVYSESPGANAPCDKCRARPASWTATDARVEPWVDRLLCAPCTAEELTPRALADIESVERWVTGLSEKGRRTGAERITSAIGALEQWWAHLPAPPEVAAALARIRALAP